MLFGFSLVYTAMAGTWFNAAFPGSIQFRQIARLLLVKYLGDNHRKYPGHEKIFQLLKWLIYPFQLLFEGESAKARCFSRGRGSVFVIP